METTQATLTTAELIEAIEGLWADRTDRQVNREMVRLLRANAPEVLAGISDERVTVETAWEMALTLLAGEEAWW